MSCLRDWIAATALVFALLGLSAFASPANAQGTPGTLAIYAYACPDGIPGSDFSGCQEHPLGGVGYTAAEAGQDNAIGGTTTANGDVSFPLDAIGGGTVNVHVSPPAGYETGFIACSQEYGAIDGGITLANVAEDGFVTCQWYFVTTGAAPDPEPTSPPATDPEPTEPPVTGLPTTGSGPVDALSDHPWVPAILGVMAMLILQMGHTLWQRRRRARWHLAERR